MPALIGILTFLGSLFAIFQVVTSQETTPNKTVWVLLIVVIPLIGLIVWIVAGPRGRNLLQK